MSKENFEYILKVLKGDLSEEEYMGLIKNDALNLKYVPLEQQTDSIILVALDINPQAYICIKSFSPRVKDKLLNLIFEHKIPSDVLASTASAWNKEGNEDAWMQAIKLGITSFGTITPSTDFSDKFWMRYIEMQPSVFGWAPQRLHTEDIVRKFCHEGYPILESLIRRYQHCPEKKPAFLNEEFLIGVAEDNYEALRGVALLPDKVLNILIYKGLDAYYVGINQYKIQHFVLAISKLGLDALKCVPEYQFRELIPLLELVCNAPSKCTSNADDSGVSIDVHTMAAMLTAITKANKKNENGNCIDSKNDGSEAVTEFFK